MKPFGVYLSARFALREQLHAQRSDLLARGFACTARWLDSVPGGPDGDPGWAKINTDDVERSDALVAFTDEPVEHSPFPFAARGGRHFEAGIAFGRRIPIVICGPRENVFHWHPLGVEVVPTWSDALGALERLRNMLTMRLPPQKEK